MDDKFSKPYNPQETEETIYKKWLDSGFFNPDKLPGERAEPFTIIMPPPNANGSLHAGHAVFVTIEDLLIRYKRMRGFKALWLPGADHAGFETQIVYEKKLEKEGRSRFNMDPDELRSEIMEFTLANKTHMEEELRSLGASCDWSRETFTLDEKIVKTVYNTFQKLYDDDLLYRGKRSVNWCVKHQTSLSDLETNSVEQVDPLYYIKYGPFTLATVRPETKFGDTALAVHPDDPRYKKWIGKEIEVEGLLGPIKLKIIGDDFVDPEFGTGVVKVTPAHDPNDFAMAQRHNLEIKEVIDEHGKLNNLTGKYAGLKIAEARKIIVEDLKKAGLLEKIDESYTHTVKVCYKCARILEPRVLPQWFVLMKPLADRAISEIEKEGNMTFYPEGFKKIALQWLTDIQDWNISRQIVWGIPIPAKICNECDEGFPDIEDTLKECPRCGGPVRKDTDTFDTWFSSGQWPFATLGYPDDDDYKTFYPTDVLETASDIIFFWVTRMIMLGLYRTDTLPFNTVYLHGLVTAPDGSKMSKSKGNVINPMDISKEFGTDALRMSLIIGNTPGTPTPLDINKVKAYKHFANKMWNVARFILMNTKDFEETEELNVRTHPKLLEYFERLNSLVGEVTSELEGYRLHLAGEKLYHYFWHEFADSILEESKTLLDSDAETRKATQALLTTILTTTLKLLHPFMPFVTEEIWCHLPKNIKGGSEMLIVTRWPEVSG